MKKYLLDSSALIPLIIAEHDNSSIMLDFIKSLNKHQLYISQHTIAEVFNVATGAYKIGTDSVLEILKYLVKNGTLLLVSLTKRDYFKSLELMNKLGLKGATIYDALIFNCALKAKVDAVITFNRKHYLALAKGNANFIITPN